MNKIPLCSITPAFSPCKKGRKSGLRNTAAGPSPFRGNAVSPTAWRKSASLRRASASCRRPPWRNTIWGTCFTTKSGMKRRRSTGSGRPGKSRSSPWPAGIWRSISIIRKRPPKKPWRPWKRPAPWIPPTPASGWNGISWRPGWGRRLKNGCAPWKSTGSFWKSTTFSICGISPC